MSGQPNPVKLVEAFAKDAPTDGSPGGKTVPFPVPSQIPLGSPGKASLATGFTPLNMTALGAGGIPMSGLDLNGIFYLLSTTIAAVSAGQVFNAYDAAYQTAIGGYNAGAILQQAAHPLGCWISTVNANVTDPDTGGAGWVSTIPLHTTLTAASGATHDQVLSNASDQVLDIDTTAGAATFDSFVAQRDGQRLIISCTGANALTVGGTGGTAANRIRQSAPLTLLTNDSITIQYCSAISRWVVA